MNIAQRSQITVYHDDANRLVIFSFPEVDEELPSASLTWDLDGKQWGRLTYGRTAFDTGDVFDFAITCNKLGDTWGQKQEADPVSGLTLGQLYLREPNSLATGYGELGYGDLGYGGSILT
jgi:hypothetical protein